jgi:uncharacterized membrane protein YGL010W
MALEIALIIACVFLLLAVWFILGVVVLLRDTLGHKMGIVGKMLCAPLLGFTRILFKLGKL